VPAIPFALELAGTEFEMVMLAEKFAIVTVLTEALISGLRRIKTLSVDATLEAVGSSDTFFELSAINIYS
jgi:hypothetical protein